MKKPSTHFHGCPPNGVPLMSSVPPATSATAHVKCCLPGKLIRNSCPELLLGDWLLRDSACHILKLQTQKSSKYSAWTVSFAQFRHREPLLAVLEVMKPSQRWGFLMPTKVQPWKQNFLKVKGSNLPCWLFPHTVKLQVWLHLKTSNGGVWTSNVLRSFKKIHTVHVSASSGLCLPFQLHPAQLLSLFISQMPWSLVSSSSAIRAFHLKVMPNTVPSVPCVSLAHLGNRVLKEISPKPPDEILTNLLLSE